MRQISCIVYLCLLVCALPTYAEAAQFSLKAKSAVTTRVHVYKSWKKDCSANIGVVKLVSKPTHGKLVTSAIDSTINVSRHNPGKTAHCVGKPIPGFKVDYTPDPNFRGRDTFTIQATWGMKKTEFESYVVDVD